MSAYCAQLKPVFNDPVSFTQTQFDATLSSEKVWGVMLLVPIGHSNFGASRRRRVAAFYCPPPFLPPGIVNPFFRLDPVSKAATCASAAATWRRP